jgi:hypothetical protein
MPRAKKVAKKRAAAGRASRKAERPARSAHSKLKRRPASGAAKTRRKIKKPSAALGRVKVPADARLDIVFQKDYQAREIFDFLKVETIRELEQFAPDQIVEKLTGPLMQTVQRIRKMLAMANRHLAKDQKFAKAFQAEVRRMA